MKKLILFSLLAVTFMSCAHYSDGQSVWTADGEPMWLLPLLPFLGGCFFLYKSIVKSRSGSERQLPGGGYEDLKKNIPFYRQNVFIYAVVLFAAAIGIIIAINGDK